MSTGEYPDEKVKLSSQGKTTLPQQARRYLGVEKGDRLSFQIDGDGQVVVEKVE